VRKSDTKTPQENLIGDQDPRRLLTRGINKKTAPNELLDFMYGGA
jgi:hypothetical protein